MPVKTVEPSEGGGVMASETVALEFPLLGGEAPADGGLETPVRSLDGPPAEMRVESEPPGAAATIDGGDTAGPVNERFVPSAPEAGVVMWITGTSTTTALVDTATVAVVGVTTVWVTTVVVTGAVDAGAGWIVDDEDGALIGCWLEPELTIVSEDEVLGAEDGAGWLLGGVGDWLLGAVEDWSLGAAGVVAEPVEDAPEGEAGVEASGAVELVLGAADGPLGVDPEVAAPDVAGDAETTSAAVRMAGRLTVPVAAAEGDAGVTTAGGVPVAVADGG